MGASETAIAAPVVAWLEDLGWQVYREVHTGGQRPDIVAVKGPLIWVVEAKTSLSLQLLDQVCWWISQANFVSIATPHHKALRFLGGYLREQGIGEFEVRLGMQGSKWDLPCADEKHRAGFRRIVDQRTLRASLHPDQLSQTAGMKGGGYSTPFSRTCENLRDFLRANPRASLKTAIDGIKHHYATPSSARNSLAHWIRSGKVPGVKLEDRQVMLIEEAR